MVWQALSVILLAGLFLAAVHACEPVVEGRHRSLPLSFIPIALGLAWMTVNGIRSHAVWLAVLPSLIVAALCLHSRRMFRR